MQVVTQIVIGHFNCDRSLCARMLPERVLCLAQWRFEPDTSLRRCLITTFHETFTNWTFTAEALCNTNHTLLLSLSIRLGVWLGLIGQDLPEAFHPAERICTANDIFFSLTSLPLQAPVHPLVPFVRSFLKRKVWFWYSLRQRMPRSAALRRYAACTSKVTYVIENIKRGIILIIYPKFFS